MHFRYFCSLMWFLPLLVTSCALGLWTYLNEDHQCHDYGYIATGAVTTLSIISLFGIIAGACRRRCEKIKAKQKAKQID